MMPPTALPRCVALFGLLALSLVLAGCGVGVVATSVTGDAEAISGNVHGGTQPIIGASIQLFAVGTGGNGSQATSLLNTPVTTDAHAGFSLTGDYTCPSANSQVYLVARGGNPGFSSNTTNQALVLMSPLGNCSDLINNPNRFISVNEVSTVAAVYALAPFMTAYDHVGTSATNVTGIANAFLNAQMLVNPATGLAPQLASNLRIEAAKLYGLADAIVPCVNSDGGRSCAPLFAASTPGNGPVPSDTVTALLNIVKAPGNNVGAVFNLIGSTPPYPGALTSAPHDWTMSLTVTGGGLSEPTQLALDKFGNVWAANYGDPGPAGLVAFSPQGTPFTGSPFGTGLQTEAYGLTLDKNGDVWVTSKENIITGSTTGSVAKFAGAGSSQPGALLGQFYDSTLSWPESIAADPAGNGTVLIGNYLSGNVTFYDLQGNFLKSAGSNVASFPVAVTSDGAGGAWLGAQGYNDIVHVLANSSVVDVTCCYAAQTVNLDPAGNVWVTNFVAVGRQPQYTFSEVAPNGSVLISRQPSDSLFSPGGGAVDSGGQFWVANYYGATSGSYATFAEIAGNSAAVAPGTSLSPLGGFGSDAQIGLAYAIAPDASGNIWVADRSQSSLHMFFGMATPTATPATPKPTLP